MVALRIVLLTLLLPLALCGDVDIRAKVEGIHIGVKKPVPVMITITRDADDDVDVSTFTVGGKPVAVEHVGDTRQSSLVIINGKRNESNTIVSRYRFELEGRAEGLHALPPIAVKVGGEEHRTSTQAYEITSGQKSAAEFRLEEAVDGPMTLYPGQQTRLLYRLYFKHNLELSTEFLPMLSPDGFEKIGDKQAKSYFEGNFNVQEIAQKVRASQPGVYEFPPGVLEGFRYSTDLIGRRHYKKPPLRAESKGMTVEVLPFPVEGRPASFSGAVGTFQMRVQRVGDGPVLVGDKVELKVTLVGSEEMDQILLPQLATMPGFSNNFRLSDLPPKSIVERRIKTFTVEVRPLSSKVTMIPPVEFSFFDPDARQYRVLRGDTIPLEVLPGAMPPQVVVERERKADDFVATSNGSHAIEIAALLPLDASDLNGGIWSRWKGLWTIPIALAALLLQYLLRRRISAQPKDPRPPSRKELDHAISRKNYPTVFFGLVEKALVQRLNEQGHIDGSVKSPQMLPEKGPAGEVRSFLIDLSQRRFSGENISPDTVVDSINTLYTRL